MALNYVAAYESLLDAPALTIPRQPAHGLLVSDAVAPVVTLNPALSNGSQAPVL
jgi:hypothetical protein